MKRLFLLILGVVLSFNLVEAKPKQLKDWQPGYLDIHHISTGRGNAIFHILPDGTRMLVDAGDLGDQSKFKQKIMPAVPNADKRAAEWIARYIEHFSKPLGRDLYLDYAMVTHFDTDHYGTFYKNCALTVKGKPYKYTGMTHLVNLVPVRTMIDRGYPDYAYPTPEQFRKRNGKLFANYLLMMNEREQLGLKNEKFEVGSDSQIVLKSRAESYPSFRIMNIAGNGLIWTGKGNVTRSIIPEGAPAGAFVNENSSSCVYRLEYGDFAYYSGGDISGTYSKKRNNFWNDVQTPVSKVIGTVDVAVADHHGYRDSMNENLLKALQTNAIVFPIWDYYHPHPQALNRINEQGVAHLFAAGFTEERRENLGEMAERIHPSGHIVVRVYKGGKRYQIFVLNDRSLDYEVIFKSRVFRSRGNKQ